MASKKFDLPDPFRPTMTLCFGLRRGWGCEHAQGEEKSSAKHTGRQRNAARSVQASSAFFEDLGIQGAAVVRGDAKPHLKGSISDWLRKDRNPDMITCLMCMVPSPIDHGSVTNA